MADADTLLFDRYRLLEPAGRGGSAEVWRARDEATGDIVAVKRLHPIVFADEAGRRRLEREFAALRGLTEPHIVRVRDLEVGDRDAALILDFVPGESLAERLAHLAADGRRMPPEAAVSIVADIAAALAAAHAAGLVHRDVTPGNILVGDDGVARLTDFGIAHATTDATAVTATGLLMGTMRYLAPEQLRAGTATPASDLHGLAAVAYEMLAGHPAYAATSPVALAEAQESGPSPIVGVPAALDAAVRRGLAVDPAQRPADVSAFAASIAAAAATPAPLDGTFDDQADEPTIAIALPPAGSLGAVGAGGASQVGRAASGIRPARLDGPAPASAGRPTARRHRIPAPVVAVIGLLIAAGALLAAATTDPPFAGPVTSPGVGAGATPTATPSRPAATPVPEKPGKGDEDKGKGKGNGKGNGG
jgi:serine/threonine-protein kinase